MSAAAEAQLIMKYFGAFGKKVSSAPAAQKAVSAAFPKGASKLSAGARSAETSEHIRGVTFFPAAMRRAMSMAA